MSLIKHSPISSLFGPAQSFDSVLDQFFNRGELSNTSGFLNPATDVKETAEAFKITSEMPGVSKEDVKVDLHDGVLTISAEKSEEKDKQEDGKVVWRERRQGQFVRRFNLGPNIDTDHIKADFSNGVLSIEIQKTEIESPKPTKIPIN